MTPRPPRLLRAALVLLLAGASVACGTGTGGGERTDGAPGASRPVTVQSCGEPVTFDEAPRRAFVRDSTLVEMMLALGLRERMVARSEFHGDKVRTPLPEYRDAFASLPLVGEGTLTLEPLVARRPDFVFAGWNYGLTTSSGVTPQRLAQRGIGTYVLSETCRFVERGLPAPTVQTTFADVRNVARIFRVEDRAEALIEAWRARIAEVERRVAGERRPRVFVYMGGTDAPSTGGGLTVLSDVIARAGGESIAADLAEPWGPISWETVISRRPELIVIGDYGEDRTPQQKVDTLLRDPRLRDVPAIRERNFLVLPAEAVNPGVRNAWGIERLAHRLHPDRVPAEGPVLDPPARPESAR